MAYNMEIVERIDAQISGWTGIEKRRMFGGICYLVQGNICFGIWQEQMIVRLGADAAAEKLQLPHVRPCDITGKPMKGWLLVAKEGWQDAQESGRTSGTLFNCLLSTKLINKYTTFLSGFPPRPFRSIWHCRSGRWQRSGKESMLPTGAKWSITRRR